MRTFTFAIMGLLAAVGAAADPGTSVGNGGQSVVCRDNSGKILSTETMDLFEGRVLAGYQYIFPAGSDPAVIALDMARKIDLSQGGAAGGTQSIEGKVRYVIDHMIALPPGVGLKPTEDSREFVFPKNCEIVQTINFRQNLKIYFDSDAWTNLSAVNRAALYLHEAVYWHLRESGVETDSRRTRKIVSFVMSGGALPKRVGLEPWLMKVQYCHSIQFNESQDWSTKLMAFKDLDNKLVIQFLQIGSFRVLTKSLLVSDPDKSIPVVEPIQKDSEEIRRVSGVMSSPMDPDAEFTLSWGKGKVTLKGSLQEGSLIQDELECIPWEITWK